MIKILAKRILFYSLKGSDIRNKFIIRIGSPYIVDEDMVDFPIGEGLVGCRIETEGLEKEFHHEVYGVDEIQAINIASNIEPFLQRLQKKYDLYWPSGDPYFENPADKS